MLLISIEKNFELEEVIYEIY